MKKFLRVANVLLILASFFGCKVEALPSNDDEVKTGTIVGYAKYVNSDNHSGIQIRLVSTDSTGLFASDYCASRGISTPMRAVEDLQITNKEGKFTFTNVLPGTYTIYASSDSTCEGAVTTDISVQASQTVTIDDLGLTATGNLKGKILLDDISENLVRFDVFIDGTSYFAITDSEGNFEISKIPAGKDYSLSVRQGNFLKNLYSKNLEVIANNTVILPEITISSSELNNNTKENETNQITRCEATEEGIKFYGNLLNNISNSNSNSYTSCTIKIKDLENNVSMINNYQISTGLGGEWIYVYPLVTKGKEYKFEVTMSYFATEISSKQFTITAIGGLGEFKVENANDYEVTLSDSRVISRTEQQFTDNKNVPIYDYGTRYILYSSNKNAIDMWDGSFWLVDADSSKQIRNQEFDIPNVKAIAGWITYEQLDLALQGRQLGVRSTSYIKIAGYDYNNTTLFELNDYKESLFDWDNNESKKVFAIYGIQIDDNDFYLFNDVPGLEKKYILISEDKISFVDESTPNAKEVYGKTYEIYETIYSPIYLPDLSKIPFANSIKNYSEYYRFTGAWGAFVSTTNAYSLPSYSVNLLYSNATDFIIDDVYYTTLIQPIVEQYKATAHFYDTDKETLLKSIDTVLAMYSEYFKVTFPPVPEKEGFIGYWEDETGNLYESETTCILENPINKFFAKYISTENE